MKKITNLLFLVTILFQLLACKEEKKAIDKMDWWKEAKFGMFIHWGLYSFLK